MSGAKLGRWEPLTLEVVAATFAPAPFRWWVSGGQALELHVGRSWRDHEDIDVGISRGELAAIYKHLSAWDIHVAAAGELSPWRGEPLETDRHQNNLWCRRDTGPWELDLTVGEGSDESWIYRRDRSVQVSWDLAVLRTADDVPYLAPELQLLYKSKGLRPKDDVDGAEVIPSLDDRRRRWLSQRLEPDHPWQSMLI